MVENCVVFGRSSKFGTQTSGFNTVDLLEKEVLRTLLFALYFLLLHRFQSNLQWRKIFNCSLILSVCQKISLGKSHYLS